MLEKGEVSVFFGHYIYYYNIFIFLICYFIWTAFAGTSFGVTIRIDGNLAILFSLWAIYSLRKDGYVGMIISDEGITDLSTGYRIGTVLWNDVTKIKVMDDLENLNYKYVVLVVKNPNQYIMQEPIAIKNDL